VIEALVYSYFDRLEISKVWPKTGEAAERYLPDEPLGQATLLCVSAVSAVALGSMDEAVVAARAAYARMRLVHSPLGENFCLLHEGQALTVMGQLEQGRSKVDEALALAEENFGTDSSLKALVGCFKAQQLFLEGRWADAQPLIESVQDSLLQVDGWLDVFAVMAEVGWRIALRFDGQDKALAILDNTARLARQRNMPRLARMVLAWRVDYLVQCGQIAQAQKEATASSLDDELTAELLGGAKPDWRFMEAASLSLARMLLSIGGSHAAQARLWRATRILRDMGLHLPAWRVGVMSMLVDQRVRGTTFSAKDAGVVLEPVLQNNLYGFLMELGQQILPVLQLLEGTLSPQALATANQIKGWAAPRRRSLCSAKELEVLTLLVAGQPNKLIARAMGISADTVKFHLKQIYRKLGVDNRSSAVNVAIRQGLVDCSEVELPAAQPRQVSAATLAPRAGPNGPYPGG
jgi:LuxR family maltose regulon positive regulatory protein